jgi:outer membrane protein OmpA-like peptidoglycan-associated protein
MRCYPSRWLWGLIPIAMLSWIAVQNQADRIESDLETRSRRVLDRASLDWVSIVFSGRDGLLVGTAPRQQDRTAALALVSGVWGVREVVDRMRLAADPAVAPIPADPPVAALKPGSRTPPVAAKKPADALPPAVPLAARAFKAGEGGRWTFAQAAAVAGETPAMAALGRPRSLDVASREIVGLRISGAGPSRAATIVDRPDTVTVATRATTELAAPTVLKAPTERTSPTVKTQKPEPAPVAAATPSPETVPALKAEVPRPGGSLTPAETPSSPVIADTVPQTVTVVRRENAISAAPVVSSKVDAAVKADTPAASDVSVPAARAPAVGPYLPPVRKPAPEATRDIVQVPLPSRKIVVAERTEAAPASGAENPSVPLPAPEGQLLPEAASEATSEAGPGAASGGSARQPMATAAVSEADAEALAECRAAILSIDRSGEVRFSFGEARIEREGRELLDRLAQVVSACPRIGLDIAGHTDSRGPGRRNTKLSQRRARAAVRYLVDKGIDAHRLKAVGYGETRPLAPNDTVENRAKNRRIEVEARDLGAAPASSPTVVR